MGALQGLQPERVFYYFEEISKIPRGSYNEKAISDYLVGYAKEHNFTYFQDELFNVVMQVPASKGREAEEPIIMQGHMDMVCEVRPGVDKDMTKEGLELHVEGDYIYAKDTTLGGDDGIAVAYMLAIADDESVSHPPLEFIITVSEEVGMEGANAIDLSMLKGHKMLNLDSEDEGIFLSSCAGGVSAHVTIPVTRAAINDVIKSEDEVNLYRVVVSGLKGGHSGTEIDKGRANSNKLLGRVLSVLSGEMNLALAELSGGKKDNAIPICTEAVIGVDKDISSVINEMNIVFKNEYSSSDQDVEVIAENVNDSYSKSELQVLTDDSRDKVITYLMCVPNGIQNMSMSVPGLVETSLNLGILELKEDYLFAQHSVRSSVTTRKDYLVNRLKSLAETLGGNVESKGSYPAWEYRENSEVRERVVKLYEEMYDSKPVVEGIHAGLECGLLASKIPDLDCVAMGPNILDIHTYNEKLSISSTKRVYEFVLKYLEK